MWVELSPNHNIWEQLKSLRRRSAWYWRQTRSFLHQQPEQRAMKIIMLIPLALLLTPVLVKSQQSTNVTRPVFPCGGQIVSEQGYVASEGFPALYPPNKKCSWTITVPPGRVVILSFRHMDLETDPICRYDHINIYNGNAASAEKLGRFCGTFRPGAVMSTSNTMLIEMVSDDDSAGKGFLAVYTAGLPPDKENQFCGGKLVKPQGSFKTPNWPNKEYPTGISCSWHIVGRPNEFIELKFEKFGIESDNYCRYDYVAVFNGGRNDEAQRAGKFCGDHPPDPIISEGNEMLVQFVSDLSVTSDGFLAKYDVRRKKGVAGIPLPTITTTTHRPTTTKAPKLKGTVIQHCAVNAEHRASWTGQLYMLPVTWCSEDN
ncbi:procollagen C-endopeptidase enhancer 2-like [Heterodontus francisci]|uniref:procollagen C-endopeptidase enhancer 2-like n=1 Tax=Heterodontus francisci TaxID=7792 RepID=UPI00355AD4DA